MSLTTEEIMEEFGWLCEKEKMQVMWGALDAMGQYNGRSPSDCVCLAMGYDSDDYKTWHSGSELTMLGKAKELAIQLHELDCGFDHTDECSWGYEFVDGKHLWNRYAHQRYLNIVLNNLKLTEKYLPIRAEWEQYLKKLEENSRQSNKKGGEK